MAELNENPRQKMIGILYLVLLGLAATTITDHVLDAFFNITMSLEHTSSILKKATDDKLASFQAGKMKDDPVRATPYFERAKKVMELCESLDKYVLECKGMLMVNGGGYNLERKDTIVGKDTIAEVMNRSDIDVSSRIMKVQKVEGGLSRGEILKKRIINVHDSVEAIMTPEERTGATIPLNAKDPPRKEGIKQTWENDAFGEGIPLTAALTALSKVEMDIKNTENSVVRKILSSVDKAEINLDQYDVIAIPESNYILIGQSYKAEVFLTAFSATLNPEINAGGQNLKVENGKGIYTSAATSEGLKKFSATIKMKKADGTFQTYTTKKDLEYMVAKPSVTISPTKMLVFYIGVPNPVSVSAAGVGKESIRTTITGPGTGEMTGSNGEYTVTVKKTGKVTIAVSGELEKGKQTVLGSCDFKCKSIPAPHPMFAGKGGGSVPSASLKSQTKLFAKLDDFDFDAQFVVNGFKLIIMKPRAEAQVMQSNGHNMTPEMQSDMGVINAGTRIMFDNIVTTGPDGLKRTLDPITFTAQ